MSQLSEALAEGRFVYTGEIGPPKGVDLTGVWAEAEKYRGIVDAVNVTDSQSAVMRLGSMAVSKGLLDKGIEPIFQMTCRDRNRIALQSDILSAYALGLRNLLIVTGDHVVLGDHKGGKPVFDLDSVSLLKAVSGLEAGQDMAGNQLEGAPEFFKGAVVTPCAESLEPQIIKMGKKIEAGAQFFQTQAVFSVEQYEVFAQKTAHLNVPVILGLVLLKSPRQANFMNRHVPGIYVPEDLIHEIGSVDNADRKKKSVEIAVRLIRGMKGMCSGVHIMPLGWSDLVPEIIKEAEV